jgi:hypothetical protein
MREGSVRVRHDVVDVPQREPQTSPETVATTTHLFFPWTHLGGFIPYHTGATFLNEQNRLSSNYMEEQTNYTQQTQLTTHT